jgi:alkylhydroperoxidase family enzyme
VDIGSAVSRDQGVSADEIAALAGDLDSGSFDEPLRAALAYADAMSATPAVVSDEVFARVRAHFDERALVELTAAIAWENYRARFNCGLGVEAEGFSEGAVCVVPAARGA